MEGFAYKASILLVLLHEGGPAQGGALFRLPDMAKGFWNAPSEWPRMCGSTGSPPERTRAPYCGERACAGDSL